MRNLDGIEIVKSIRKFLGEEIPDIIYSDDESTEARDAAQENKCIFILKLREANTLANQVS